MKAIFSRNVCTIITRVSRFISLHHSFRDKGRVSRRKSIQRKQNTSTRTRLSRYVFIAKLLSLL